MKIMEGQLKETLYAWPRDPNVEQPLAVTNSNIYKKNEVAYICGKIISIVCTDVWLLYQCINLTTYVICRSNWSSQS